MDTGVIRPSIHPTLHHPPIPHGNIILLLCYVWGEKKNESISLKKKKISTKSHTKNVIVATHVFCTTKDTVSISQCIINNLHSVYCSREPMVGVKPQPRQNQDDLFLSASVSQQPTPFLSAKHTGKQIHMLADTYWCDHRQKDTGCTGFRLMRFIL